MDINIMDYYSNDYPEKLREIHDPPRQLYYAGDKSLLKSRCVGIVGARRNTMYGKNVTLMISRRLADSGITVVSGLAMGIDAFSHEGALEAGGKVIGVLGSGINEMGPKRNEGLMKRGVENGGLVISEYPPAMKATRRTFPERNRIISGISEAVIVVEAGLNSGSLITAKFAADQGRNVYAVPGNINSHSSIGCNLLIRDGASPLIIVDDVLRDLGIKAETREEEILKFGADERMVFESARTRGGATIDEIIFDSGLSASTVSALVTVMEIKGAVETYAGRVYAGGLL